MTQEEHKNLIEKIKSGEVKMHSRAYFGVKSTLQFLGLVLAVLLAIFMTSYAFFHLKISGAFGFTYFGIYGIRDLLLSLPWLILLLALLFTALLLWFAERYPFAYRNPVLYSVGGILLVVFFGGYIVAKTSLHPYFFRMNALRPVGRGIMMFGLYPQQLHPDLHNGLVGKIETWEQENRLVRAFNDKVYRVFLIDNTSFPPGGDIFQIGDIVLIHGKIDDNRVQAWGIRKVVPNEINCGAFCNTK